MRDAGLQEAEGSAGVPAVTFDAAAMPAAQRFDAWQARQAGLSALELAPEDRGGFTAASTAWALGPMLVSVTRCSALAFERSPRHIRRDGLDHWMIRLILSGRSISRYAQGEVPSLPGQPFLAPLDSPWQARWTDSEWISLFIPRDAMPGLSRGLAGLGTGPLDGPGVPLLAEWMALLERRLRTAGPEEAPHLAEATAAAVAACLLSGGAGAALRPGEGALARMEQARMLMRRHHASACFTPERMAGMMGMSRTALYKLFEPQGGVARALQRMRLSLARAALEDPARLREGIGAIAERHGFFDHTAFTRAFRQEYGHTPSEVRRAATAGLHLPAPAAPALGEATLGGMLARLAQD